MSVVSFRTSVLATSTNILRVELGRSFIQAITFTVQAAAAITGEMQLRIFSKGNTVAPVISNGGDNFIYLMDKAPTRFELKKELNGPPYELEIQVTNPTAAAVNVSGIIEVYNSPYPQTRLYISPGREGENPFSALYAGVAKEQTRIEEEKAKRKNGK